MFFFGGGGSYPQQATENRNRVGDKIERRNDPGQHRAGPGRVCGCVCGRCTRLHVGRSSAHRPAGQNAAGRRACGAAGPTAAGPSPNPCHRRRRRRRLRLTTVRGDHGRCDHGRCVLDGRPRSLRGPLTAADAVSAAVAVVLVSRADLGRPRRPWPAGRGAAAAAAACKHQRAPVGNPCLVYLHGISLVLLKPRLRSRRAEAVSSPRRRWKYRAEGAVSAAKAHRLHTGRRRLTAGRAAAWPQGAQHGLVAGGMRRGLLRAEHARDGLARRAAGQRSTLCE